MKNGNTNTREMEYDGHYWSGENATIMVRMTDAVFQKHLNAYLESTGVPTQTYSELMEHVSWAVEQRFLAVKHLANVDYWRNIHESEVRIIHLR